MPDPWEVEFYDEFVRFKLHREVYLRNGVKTMSIEFDRDEIWELVDDLLKWLTNNAKPDHADE